MSPDGSKLCVAGTMDDYATVVDRATLQEGPLVPASKPYWATVSGDGKDCVISESGADQVTAIDFATGQKVVVRAGRRPPAAGPPRPRPGRLDRAAGRLTRVRAYHGLPPWVAFRPADRNTISSRSTRHRAPKSARAPPRRIRIRLG